MAQDFSPAASAADGMMMPDHVPRIEGDASEAQGFAFAFGYIKALIAAVSAEE